ncbi:pupal cuticle protein G1A [Papilio machaon]|uniref:pupal cuticle protein G1A n=1 Tax=Papilio machaon TaxID=76193 RepID=UPI001E6633DC|nr:pupal cuticle protein G1A [Papilio machaon]
MFKFVVLSALVCAAVAEPGVFLAPSTYTAAIPAPVTSTYVQQSSAIYPAAVPSIYSSLSYPHYIKKREAQFYNGYIANGAYVAPAALATPYASTLVAPAGLAAAYSPAVLPYAAPAHFIKKRSASASPQLLAAPLTSTYVASAPLASSYIASAPLATTYSTPIYSSAAYYPTFSTGFPFIKK